MNSQIEYLYAQRQSRRTSKRIKILNKSSSRSLSPMAVCLKFNAAKRNYDISAPKIPLQSKGKRSWVWVLNWAWSLSVLSHWRKRHTSNQLKNTTHLVSHISISLGRSAFRRNEKYKLVKHSAHRAHKVIDRR